MNEVLRVENLNKFFGKKQILKDINFTLENKQIISVLGKSGCGKSTLLRIISGLESIDSGRVITARTISLMFQNYALMPHLNVAKNIELALGLYDKKTRQNIVDELLDRLFINDIKNAMIDEISGGQAQRVAFARAIANKAKILLLDEPFSNLDSDLKDSLRSDLKKMIKDSDISAILVTHDKEDAFAMSDKIILMQEGRILDSDSPKTLFLKPKNETIAKFLGEINIIQNKNIKNQDFLKELQKRNFMFRPHEITVGKQFKARVIKSQYFGSYEKLYLNFENNDFIAYIYDEIESKEHFYFKFR